MTDDQKAMLRLLAAARRGLRGHGRPDGHQRRGSARAASRRRWPRSTSPRRPPGSRPSPRPRRLLPRLPRPSPRSRRPRIRPRLLPRRLPPSRRSPRPRRLRRQAPGNRPPQLPGLKLPKDRGALIGLGAGALVVLVFVIVLIVGGGGGGSARATATRQSAEGGTTPATAENQNLTQAILDAVDGGEASGIALFGRFKKNVLLQVTAEGLEPSASGQSYAVWLSHSGKAMVPVGTAKVPDSGDLAARFQIPTAVLLLIARSAFDEVDVTRTSDATLSAAIANGAQEQDRIRLHRHRRDARQDHRPLRRRSSEEITRS